MKAYNIHEFISILKDPRRGQGQRHKLHDIVVIIIMAILSGYQGVRGFTRFASSNKELLSEALQLKHGVPSYQTIQAIFTNLNQELVAEQFIEWMKKQEIALDDNYLSLDGKSIKSSVKGGNTKDQNFVAVVSAFGHKSGMVYGMQSYESGKSGEVPATQNLITKLGLLGKIYSMDAAHCKKNT